MTKIYSYKGNIVRKSKSEKNNYRYAIAGTYEDGKMGFGSCSCDCTRLEKDVAEQKAYYTWERVEKAQYTVEHPETSYMWNYWQYENASWTKEEVINAIKRDADMYRRRYFFWNSAKVVELDVVVK